MANLIDVDKGIKGFEEEILMYEAAIEALKYKIQVAKELIAHAAPTAKSTASASGQAEGQMSLAKSIIHLLDQSTKWHKARDITEQLLENGFTSESSDFNLLVANTLNKMRKANKVKYKRKNKGAYYASLRILI